MSIAVTILGSGNSSGVPVVGCDCKTCTSDNPKNKRLRASIWVQTNQASILFDSSPDLRQQALAAGMTHIDAVVYTHEHADHTHGLDDLRNFNYALDGELPVYADAHTLAELKNRFGYAFQGRPGPIWYRPAFDAREIHMDPPTPFAIGDAYIQPFLQHHGPNSDTLGFRIGDFAYSTDVKTMPEASFDVLEGVDTWLVDCLRYTEAPTHANLERTLEWLERVKPGRAILTHMGHELEYEELAAKLPKGVEPGFDGMKIIL